MGTAAVPDAWTRKAGNPDSESGQALRQTPPRSGGRAQGGKAGFQPYWGKPTVRDFRGGDGNVGIIRSPVRAIVLLDHESLRICLEKRKKLTTNEALTPLGQQKPLHAD